MHNKGFKFSQESYFKIFVIENELGLFFQAGALKRFIPLFDRVLIERMAAETQTKGGVLIPEKAQSKVQTGTVVAVGKGTTADVCVNLSIYSIHFQLTIVMFSATLNI